MRKKYISIILAMIVLILFIIGFSVAKEVILGLFNDPNRETNKYDLTCEFRLENPILFQDVIFKDVYNGKPTLSCYYVKSSFELNFGLGSLFWPSDKGTVKMTAQSKSVWQDYDIDEGSTKAFKMTLYRLQKGNTAVNLIAYNSDGKQLDSRQISINIGEE